MSEETKWQDLLIELALNAKKNLDAKDDEITILRQRLDEKTGQATRWASECEAIRQQLAEAEARVAELEGLVYRKCEHYILRKQAEAVKDSAQELLEEWPEFDVANQWLVVRSESLAQQADEAERAGGEK